MMLFHCSLQLSKRTLQGFTLPELLIAATISLGVVSLGGFGLVSLLSSSQVANAQNERRTELNRSLEFISAEVREADTIEKDASAATLPSGFTLPADGENVLMLYPEGNSSTPIIYYVASPTDNTWKGPKVVYRWGPQFNDDGTYQNLSTPTSWIAEPLIDAIEDTNTAPTCPGADWISNGTVGFGACVNALGKVAELSHAGVYDKPLQNAGIYKAQTTSIARSTQAATPSYTPPPGSDPTFTINNGTVTIRKQATMNIRVLGSEITCGEDGDPIGTTAAYNLVQGTLVNQSSLSTIAPLGVQNNILVAPGTDLTVDGTSSTGGSCSPNISVSSNTSTNRVLTLRNGDSIPDYTPYGNQLPIATISQGYIDANNRITIANNEVIFLFELGSGSPGDPSFDMQDLVMLATITPASTTTVTSTP